MRGGKRTGAGRKSTPAHLKRNKLTGFRIQQWMIDFLNAQPESGGQSIEKALTKFYKLKKPKQDA